MWGRRTAYLLTLLGSLVFYGFYKEWLSWIAMTTIFFLPILSLLISLPAMLTVKATLRCPQMVRMGMPARTAQHLECMFPIPPLKSRIRLHNSLSGESFLGEPGELIPTGHCGMMLVTYDELMVYDYLGLFKWRLRRPERTTVYILPKPVPGTYVPEVAGKAVSLWRPKRGGGFSENHDLRPYRPGDDLRNLHWKMSAKTGKLIYREPIEPVQNGYVLTLSLSGNGEELDRKLGRLLWVSTQLNAKQLEHEVRCRTGGGLVQFEVTDKDSLEAGLCRLLEGPVTSAEEDPEHNDVLWSHHIGGDTDEA